MDSSSYVILPPAMNPDTIYHTGDGHGGAKTRNGRKKVKYRPMHKEIQKKKKTT